MLSAEPATMLGAVLRHHHRYPIEQKTLLLLLMAAEKWTLVWERWSKWGSIGNLNEQTAPAAET